MERPSEGREPGQVEDAGALPSDAEGATSRIGGVAQHGGDPRAESSGRPRASMILWLVVAFAVAIGVALYFHYGPAISPLFGTPQ